MMQIHCHLSKVKSLVPVVPFVSFVSFVAGHPSDSVIPDREKFLDKL